MTFYNLLKKFYKSKYLVFFDQILASIFNFILVIFAARYLNLIEFQIFSYSLIALYFFLSLQNGIILSSYLSINNSLKKKNQKIYNTLIFFLEIILIFFTSIIFWIYINFDDFFLKHSISLITKILFTLFIISKLINDFYRKTLISNSKFLKLFFSDLIILCLFCALMFYANHFKRLNLDFFLLIVTTITLLCTWLEIKDLSLKYDPIVIKKILRRHFKSSRWLTLNSFLTIFGSTFVNLFVGFRLGGEALASLRICFNFTRILNPLILTIENYLPAIFSRMSNRNRNKYYLNLYNKPYGIILIILFSFIVMFLYTEILIKHLYGEEYVYLAFYVRWYFFMPILSLLITPFNILLRSFEKTNIIFKSYLLSTIFVLFFSNYFIQNFALMGAISLLISQQIIYFIYSIFLFNKNK